MNNIPFLARGFLGFIFILFSGCQEQSISIADQCHNEIGTVLIDKGTYAVGSDDAYPEEAPLVHVKVDRFWIEKTEVTVERFRTFTHETGYRTVAERDLPPQTVKDILLTEAERAHFLSPGSAVFEPDKDLSNRGLNWWSYVPGANWKHPRGPNKPAAHTHEPVTQIALEDALAFADWAGGRLPSEIEWEVAASFNSGEPNYTSKAPKNANTWQGVFPIVNEAVDGFSGVAPVGCYEPNAIGLYDMIGNVWEWTADPYHLNRSIAEPLDQKDVDLVGPSLALGVIKGGSFLCAPNYCRRYRSSARHPQDANLGTNHIGFRLVYDTEPNLPKSSLTH